MILTIIGILITLTEFLLLSNLFKKKHHNFYLYSFSSLLLIIFGIGIILQLLGIFFYSLLIILHLILIGFLIYKKAHIDLKNIIDYKKIDLIFIIVLIISIFCLYQVHVSYSGSVSSPLLSSSNEVNNNKLIYPYYSDEWVGLAVSKYSIEHNSFPIYNPFVGGKYFPNLEFAFHSFISSIFVQFDLNPAINYTLLGLIINIVIISLVYFILRYNKASKFVSLISSLSILYIVCGSNLPGIWHLIPMNIGILMMLIGFCFISLNKTRESIWFIIPVILFYPPLVVFYIPSLFAYLWKNKEEDKLNKNIKLIICISIAAIILLSLSLLLYKNGFFNYIFSKIVYPSLTSSGIPKYSPLTIVPIWVLILGVIGFFSNFKRKVWLTIPAVIGALYWIIYSQVLFRIVIEYQRVVFVESILLCILSGIFLNHLIEYISNSDKISKKVIKYFKILVILIFVFFSFSYTSGNSWKSLVLINENSIAYPSAPATEYLSVDDVKIFSNISEKRFISEPRKALALASITHNYPLETKPSTITVDLLSYENFTKSDCETKVALAKKYKIDYIYASKFNCTKFKQVAKSNQGFYLYKFIK